MSKCKTISRDKVVKRLSKGKTIYGLAESHYLDDEWVNISKAKVDGLSLYRVFRKTQ